MPRVVRSRVLCPLSALCTRLTGIPFTPRATFHLLHAQAGVFVSLLPVEMPILLRLMAVAWVVCAVRLVLRRD